MYCRKKITNAFDALNNSARFRRSQILTNFRKFFHRPRQVFEIFVQDIGHHLQSRTGHGVPADVGANLSDRSGKRLSDELFGHFVETLTTKL